MKNRLIGATILGLVVACWILVPSKAGIAHELNTSYTIVEIRDQHVTCTMRFDVTDFERILSLQAVSDSASQVALNSALPRVQEYVAQNVEVMVSGEWLSLESAATNVVSDSLGNQFFEISQTLPLDFQPWSITISLNIFQDFGPRHKNLMAIYQRGELQQAILTAYDFEQTFSLTQGEGFSMITQGMQFVWLGIEHIFIGYDHILFLLGLVVIGGGFRNIIKMVTAFTVAHSLTLILATLQVILLPSRLVESVIALSIVYIAVENFLIKDSDNRWMITFVFGLVHGFGFAGVLHELALPAEGLAVSLVSFNVGVEIGQVVIITMIYPVIYLATRSQWRRQFVYAVSTVILVFGTYWFIERALGFDLTLWSERDVISANRHL